MAAFPDVPISVLAEALACQLATIQGLSVQRKANRVQQRSVARVYPMRSTFSSLGQEDQRLAGQGAVHSIWQLETMQFEVALRVTDLVQRDQVFAYQESIIKAVTGFQPYIGVAGTSSMALSPFSITGAVRDQTIRAKESPIFERVLTAQCVMERLDGLPPMLVANPNQTLDKSDMVDVFGYDPWEIG